MTRLYTSLLLIIIISFGFINGKPKQLKADDPLVGAWEAESTEIIYGDAEEGEETPGGGVDIGGTPSKLLFLVAGDEESFFAAFEQPGMGYACPNYFKAQKTDTELSGTLTNKSCSIDAIGKSFTLKYEYYKKSDQLIIKNSGEEGGMKWASITTFIRKKT